MTFSWLHSACTWILLWILVGSASGDSRFLGTDGSQARAFSSKYIEARVSASLQAILHDKQPRSRQEQLDRIEAAMWNAFQAVPKSSAGQVLPRATRHLVHSYFITTHGWIINGLEPHGMSDKVTEVHESGIMLDRVPQLVEDLLEAKRADHGLSLTEVVAMAAVTEQLVLDETPVLMQTAYYFNEVDTSAMVDHTALLEILDSYVLLFESGSKANLHDAQKHLLHKRRVSKLDSWNEIQAHIRDTVGNVEYEWKDVRNPFIPSFYSLDDAWHIAEQVINGYGAVQDNECRRMMEALVQLDPKGNGRVPLSTFYSQPPTADYQFKEAAHYLRMIGALDDASGIPQVRITNYVQGPSNCLAHSTYFSICCLAPCDGLMKELEGSIQAPTAPPEQLLTLTSNLSSPSVDAPRSLSNDLEKKLHAIAQRHGGEVPLHGRLFAQWMHFAFPLECPFPHVAGNSSVMSAAHWRNQIGDFRVTPEDKARFIQEGGANAQMLALDPVTLEWSDEEVLPLQEPQYRSTISAVVRVVVQLSMILMLIRVGLAGLRLSRLTSPEKGASAFVV